MSDSSDSSVPILFDFADQLVADLEAGRALPLAHYLARFPGHEEAVAREYLALTGRSGPGTPAAEDSHATGVRRFDRVGPYRLLEVLGRGGQGVVYRAEDVRLERIVALKLLSLPLASVGQGRRNRFRREAEILSRLEHPGIATVLDADLDGEMPYLAMRFVEGETLAAALTRARTAAEEDPADPPASDTTTSASRLLAPRRALELAETLSFFERVARALHAAHEAGVIHRDIKPGNLMVSKEGAPVILDFGLARGEEQESAPITRSGEVFGTPAYISPEQLQGGRDVDRRTDVYSLGVVLYECLTLVRPFEADSSAALAVAGRGAPPTPLARHAPLLPQDLGVVLETALERDVARRYPTALELAEELRRVRVYEPIRARPAGALLRLRRWAQRNPVLATGTIGSIVSLSVALVVALVLLGRVQDEQRRKEAALALYEAGWYRDQSAAALGRSPPTALHLAIAAAERDPGLESNRVLLAALQSLWSKQLLVGHKSAVLQVDVDRDSRRVLTCSEDGSARVWDAQSGGQLAHFAQSGPVFCARFSPDGRQIVSAGAQGRVCLWDASRPEAPPIELPGHVGDVNWAEFSPDGARVLSAGRDRSVRLWDARDGRPLLELRGHAGNVAEARFLDGGRFVLTRSSEPTAGATAPESDFSARLFDAASGTELCAFRGHQGGISCMATSPDLAWLVTTSDDRSARQWRLDLGRAPGSPAPEPVRVFEAPGKFHCAAFSPDGRDLALSWDAGAKVVLTATGTLRYELPSHEHRAVARLAFSPDGERLASVAYDDALRVFRARDGELLRLCRGDARQISGFLWSPDGTFLATWQRQLTADLWYGAERPFLQVLRGHTAEVRSARFDPSGERVLTASADGTARIWDVARAALLCELDPAAGARTRVPLVGAEFDLAGERVATTDERGRVLLWRARDARLESAFEVPAASALPAAFSPDGTRLVVPGENGSALLVELASGRRVRLAGHEAALGCWRFSPDGSRLATGADDRRVCLWDASFAPDEAPASERAPLWRSEPFQSPYFHLRSVFDVDFSRDGRWIAAAGQNLRIGLYDVRDGRLVCDAPTATPGRVCFSADGRRLLNSSKYSSYAALWNLVEDARGVRLEKVVLSGGSAPHHTNSMTSIAAAASAPRMVSGSLDRSVRLWDVERGECVASYVGHTDRVLDVDIRADGRWIVSASSDGTARLWPGDVLETARRAEPAAFAAGFVPLPAPQPRQ